MQDSEQDSHGADQNIDLKLQQRRDLGIFPLLVIITTFVLVILAWQLAKYQLRKSVEQEFDKGQASVMHLISEQLRNLEGLLLSSAATIKLQGGVDRMMWRDYVKQLELERRFPAVAGMGFAQEVNRHEIDVFLATQRESDSNFKLRESPGEDRLYPVTAFEPYSANQPWSAGFDMAGEKKFHAAIMNARESGEASITASIQLQNAVMSTSNSVLFVPVYHETNAPQSSGVRKLAGLVFAPVKLNKLISKAREQGEKFVDFRLFDDTGVLIDELEERTSSKAEFSETGVLSLYGREWAIEYRSTQALDSHLSSRYPVYILVAGLLVQLLYIAALLLLSKHRKYALEVANGLWMEFTEKTQKNHTAEQRYNLAIKGSAVGLWDWDLEKENIFWSAPLFEMIGEDFIPEGIGLKYFTDRLHPDDKEDVMHQVNEHFQRNGPFNTEYRLRHADGHHVWVHASGHAMWSDEGFPLRMSGSASNVTERKLAVEELISVNSELKKFAHLASHDLKTPLRGINNLTQCIEEDMAYALDEENVARLQMIRDRVSLTLMLLQDILTYSESGNVSLTVEPVKLAEMVAEIVEHLNLSPRQQVICEGDMPEILTIATQLRQVLVNLISNAFSHHDKEDQIVRISWKVRTDDIEFSVLDDGPGIPESYLEKVFTPFHTLKAKGYGGGTGLGLSIVKSLVESGKGRVRIHSKNGCRGTRVCFTWSATLVKEVDS